MDPVTEVTPTLARAAWGSLETVHVTGFFAPEVQQAYDRFDVPATRAGYFAARAAAFGPVDWWCSDIVAYPERLLDLVTRWLEAGQVRNLVCTVKFQGPTDHAVAARGRTDSARGRSAHGRRDGWRRSKR